MELQQIDFLDFSQFSAWQKCPLAWVERYLKGYRKDFKNAPQRDDAMCIGSLVHDGLENYYKNSLPQITEESVLEHTPTPEALNLARSLVGGYVRMYPKEAEGWQLVATEKPLRASGGGVTLLAKLDAYFLVTEDTVLTGGPNGEIVVLEPGYWIQEYKTKADGRRDLFCQRWAVDKQADFQMICLRAHLQEQGIDIPVRGVLVNAIEKPRSAPPSRKCKGCKTNFEYSSYTMAPDGEFFCPMCGFKQKLTPLSGDPANQVPNFFRLPVRRNEDQLQQSWVHFVNVDIQMQNCRELLQKGLECVIPTFSSCVHPIFGPCEFFNNHTYGLAVEEDPTFVKADTIRYAQETVS